MTVFRTEDVFLSPQTFSLSRVKTDTLIGTVLQATRANASKEKLWSLTF